MSTTDRNIIRKEERQRRKRLLRKYREDEQARMWNKVVDEVGGFNINEQDWDCYTFDFLDSEQDPDFASIDERYPNKAETIHNIFECD